MLFNSHEFLFTFFPATVCLYLLARRLDARFGVATLLACSLVFYGAWDVRYVPLLIASIALNYLAGHAIARALLRELQAFASMILAVAIAIDLGLLGFFKYLHFAVTNLNHLLDANIVLGTIILPLGISFFTFEQIAYLVDVRRGETRPAPLLNYAFFVAFFPRLVAGPILRYSEIAPQIPDARQRSTVDDLSVGLTIFLIGLFKKSVLADGVAQFASPVFEAAAQGKSIDLLLGWGGALAYTCQLYFAFPGYSDMAIGAARCCGYRFPMNFNSPYKAASISDFWRRWHMTLSRFLRDYLYIALGGNRHGPARRYLNLALTMLLGGLWHGANWTFVFWGGLHGLYLVVHHAWQNVSRRSAVLSGLRAGRLARPLGVACTFLAVVVGWVFFRATSFDAALGVLAGMIGLHGTVVPSGLAFGAIGKILGSVGVTVADGSGSVLVKTYLWVPALLAIAFLAPNTQELLGDYEPVLEPGRDGAKQRLRWRPSPRWAAATAVIGFIGVISITRASEFLYWQF